MVFILSCYWSIIDTQYQFHVYIIVIWYLYTFWNGHHEKLLSNLLPYKVITPYKIIIVLLTIFLCCALHPLDPTDTTPRKLDSSTQRNHCNIYQKHCPLTQQFYIIWRILSLIGSGKYCILRLFMSALFITDKKETTRISSTRELVK